MALFGTFIWSGMRHLLAAHAFDHWLFLLAMVIGYSWREWRTLLWLVTAFTLGHSATLLWTVSSGPLMPGDWVEFLISATILLTALWNIRVALLENTRKFSGVRYGMALAFGMIHGMGFANDLVAMFGSVSGVWVPLLGLNIGLELGQLIVVFSILLAAFLAVDRLKISARKWNLVGSAIAAIIAVVLLWEHKIW
ncbi:MAG: HupE/UreJ family protein [Bacteroidota bacterium]